MPRLLLALALLAAAGCLLLVLCDGPQVTAAEGGGVGQPSRIEVSAAGAAAEGAPQRVAATGIMGGLVRLHGEDFAGSFHLLALPVAAPETQRPETVTCDAGGRFPWLPRENDMLLALPPGTHLLGLSPGLARTEWQDLGLPHDAVVVPAGTDEVELDVEVGSFVAVLPVDAADGSPIVGMRLVAGLKLSDRHFWCPLSCGPDGLRRLPRAVLAGVETVRWVAWSYPANPSATKQWNRYLAAELLAREDVLLLPVEHATPLPIEFLGPNGPLLAGVTVEGGTYLLEGPTADGRWLFHRALPKQYGVTFEADGFLAEYVAADRLGGDSLRIVMRPEVRLDLALEGAASPLGWSATVRFDLEDIRPNRYARYRYPTQTAPGEPDVKERGRYRRGRKHGTWVLDLAPDGARSLVKIAEGGTVELELCHFGRVVERRTVPLPETGRTQETFQATARERALACTVVDADGRGLADVAIQVAPRRQGRDVHLLYSERVEEDWLAPRVRTAADGTVELPLPPDDDEVVRFCKQGHADTVVPIARLRAAGGRVVLGPGRDVVLSLLGADDAPFYGGFSNGYGAHYSKPWVHLGDGLWRAAEWSETGPDGATLVPYRDWLFRDLPPGRLAYRVEHVRDFEFRHDSSVPYEEYVAPVSASDIPYGK